MYQKIIDLAAKIKGYALYAAKAIVAAATPFVVEFIDNVVADVNDTFQTILAAAAGYAVVYFTKNAPTPNS